MSTAKDAAPTQCAQFGRYLIIVGFRKGPAHIQGLVLTEAYKRIPPST